MRKKVVTIPEDMIERAGEILSEHLSTYGKGGANKEGWKLVGGDKWWRIRGRALEGEWIEVRPIRG